MARKKIEDGSKEAVQKQEFGGRILQIRRTFFDDNNRKFAEQIGENEKTLSQICSGDRNGGWAIVQKILDSMPEINANWLLRGEGEMTKSEQHIGDINNSHVVGVNVSNSEINNDHTGAYETLLAIVDKYQEQTDRILNIMERMR
ncbi:MAG: hypothetical protein IJU19_00615 [Bacteroidales bacterium]|nr:hypothetical protein [Bacteroidales bacterium]